MTTNSGLFPFLGIENRPAKPRRSGLTIVSDNGNSLRQSEDLLEVTAEIVDGAKITDHAGIIFRYSEGWLQSKLDLYKRHDVFTFPGGIPFEIAYLKGKVQDYFKRVRDLGFDGVEISDDTIPPLSERQRQELISAAREIGLGRVFTEIGRKFPGEPLDPLAASRMIRLDLQDGAEMVSVEESDVLLLKERNPSAILDLVQRVGKESVVFEARSVEVQTWLIRSVAPDLNMENIPFFTHEDVIQLERMRVGLHRRVGYEAVRRLVGETQKGG